MSTTGRPTSEPPSPSDIAPRLRDAGFVRLVAAADGDALAAAGVLADALDALAVPFQLTVARPWDRADRTTDADLTVALGGPATDADVAITGHGQPASHTAFEVSGQPASTPTPCWRWPASRPPTARPATSPSRRRRNRPGVAVPTDDTADGLAHSTLFHAPFSGDPEAATAALSDVDTDAEDADRRVASLLALSVVGDDETTPRGADAVERALRPYDGGPFGTVGGYADVLDAVAKADPGTAAALALGAGVETAALDAWRDHARAAHEAIRTATTGRYDGLTVLRSEAAMPVATVTRLVRDYRAPNRPSSRCVRAGPPARPSPIRASTAGRCFPRARRRGGRHRTAGHGRSRRRHRRRGARRPGGDGVVTDRHARITTRHDDPEVVAAALAPDNTDEMTTRVEGDRVVTTVDRD
ncbi:hypothetical protein, partial [Halapricum sp. CBA1109]|uniref:hypothetical protein n=1 Tax=Halapricum sp. CBA1109 TaxID=2668068 RepID=UPI001E561F97